MILNQFKKQMPELYKDIEKLKIEQRKVVDYANQVESVRREKGLPDPFSNMSLKDYYG